MDVFLIFFYLSVVPSDSIFYEKILIFFKYLGMKYILQKKNALKTNVNNCNEDHYFILIKFISRGLINQYKLKNFQYQ